MIALKDHNAQHARERLSPPLVSLYARERLSPPLVSLYARERLSPPLVSLYARERLSPPLGVTVRGHPLELPHGEDRVQVSEEMSGEGSCASEASQVAAPGAIPTGPSLPSEEHKNSLCVSYLGRNAYGPTGFFFLRCGKKKSEERRTRREKGKGGCFGFLRVCTGLLARTLTDPPMI